jgi:anhydro-N-acetylmuramic acid kinase
MKVSGLRRLVDAAGKPERLIVGVMSGSSLDGVDAALVRVRGCCEETEWELVEFVYKPFEPAAKERLFGLFDYDRAGVIEATMMNAVLGEVIADACEAVRQKAGRSAEEVDLLAVWPQMVFHQPGRMAPLDILGYRLGACLQLGDLNTIAERTSVSVVGSFCQRDIAAGGNGSPLTGLGDYVVYHDRQRNRVIQNIGGIANGNLVPAAGRISDVAGFDTGPGNMLIDAVVRHVTGGAAEFDRDGEQAARGHVSTELLAATLAHPFIQREPPKAAGWEDFGTPFRDTFLELGRTLSLSADDLVATATAVTVESIAQNHERWLRPRGRIDEVVVGGGGALNPTLMRMLRERLAPIPVAVDEDYAVPSFAKEAIYMAFLGNEALMGHPNNVPSVTGAERAVVMGVFAPAS